ncbi:MULTISPECIES: type VI secretion system Vgr family protein [unclassified Duganella]|uniref:type VI secretion system Vgr family protein n=1 Tax=unclassified Duganella TaxID=2636909 RepID=UPI0008864C12|nr:MULTISPECIES: type VI secretion system Vgr family protein [unclassified Duganella]SDH49174.1 type VI secretion system secreted protein VgrG [Duganella sp. OV458]SDK64181.1 type VI secretion system secreted protein VgrG [Duganella sp. OV510]
MESDSDFFSFMTVAKELVTDNRPLRLRLDLPGGANDDMLLPQRVYGSETLCGGIEYRVLCVSANAQMPLKQLIAVPAVLEFVTDRGDLRNVCGIVTEASSGDSDGGLASYQLVLRDALAILEKRSNTRVFRNMNEVEIVQRILNEWRQKSPVLGTCFKHETDDAFSQRTYPKRELTMQHNESDAAFIRRLLKRRGIGWYIRAEGSGHTLVLFNSADSLRQNAAGTIRYHRDSATEERDTITAWSAVRSLQPGMVTRHSWDYMNPQGRDFMLVEAGSGIDQGVSGNELAASLDDYQILPPHAGDDNEDLFRLGQLRMNRHDYESKCFHGEGSVRDLCAGEYFTLAEHPEVDDHSPEDRDFVVTALQVTAQNNLPKALAARVERLFTHSRWMAGAQELLMHRDMIDKVASGPLRMHVQFTAARRGVTIVPAYDASTDLPQAQMQSAIVVGPEGEEVHCDQLGRVKIRFPGTRAEDHEEASGTGASDTQTDSAWVRVASNWAGNGPGPFQQCGTIGLPRVGTEVLVAFLGGDPDKPVIVGQLYNQDAMPAALSSASDLPGNRYLSGIKSREINGGRANQLRLDDTEGQISAQLASDHGDSQLNLGFLTQPIRDGCGESRGQGAELRSDKAVAVRGVEGILITAEESPKERIHLDRNQMIGLVKSLQKTAEQLSKLAVVRAKDEPDTDQLSELVHRLQHLDKQAASVVGIFAPDGIVMGSGKSMLFDASKGMDFVSAAHARIGATGPVSLRSAADISIFSNEGGAKITAASGKILAQAQSDGIEILAKKVLDIISANDWINIRAQQGVRINAGGSELVIDAKGIKGYTCGKHEMHASVHQTFGPQAAQSNLHREFPELSELLTEKTWVEVTLMDGELPAKGERYVITDAEGTRHEGILDDSGFARVESVVSGHCKLEFPEVGRCTDLKA